MEQQLFDVLVNQNDIGWKALIYDLVRSQRMDPWDINITVLSQKYIERLKHMQELDLNVSGKVLLAAAILLKIKSKKLLSDDLMEFDRLLAGQPDEEAFFEELQQGTAPESVTKEEFPLYPRTPQPRRRKVSVFDLLHALEKALEVKNRRANRLHDIVVPVPEKNEDITITLQKLFTRIVDILRLRPLTFAALLQTPSREEKIKTFIPVLYLSNEKKVRLKQQQHFGDIFIELPEVKVAHG